MAGIDLIDETFIAADVRDVAAIVAEEARWSQWFPGLRLTVFMDRGLKGIRWSVAGTHVGSTEIWLEPFADGVILHYYLRVEPTRPGSVSDPAPFADNLAGYRKAAQARQVAALRWKRLVWELKDELEAGREVGTAARRYQADLQVRFGGAST